MKKLLFIMMLVAFAANVTAQKESHPVIIPGKAKIDTRAA